MAGLTPAHLLIILVIALVVIGPGKLPEVGAAIGKSFREFQKATSGVLDSQPAPTQPAPPMQAPMAPMGQPMSQPVAQAPMAPPQAGYYAPAQYAPQPGYPQQYAPQPGYPAQPGYPPQYAPQPEQSPTPAPSASDPAGQPGA